MTHYKDKKGKIKQFDPEDVPQGYTALTEAEVDAYTTPDILFKGDDGDVYAYSQKDIDEGWKEKGLRKMTAKQVEAHLNPPVTAEDVRRQRDAKLRQLDAIVSNPLRWAEVEQGAYAAYRQALLDVPEQAGFPENAEWPEMPG